MDVREPRLEGLFPDITTLRAHRFTGKKASLSIKFACVRAHIVPSCFFLRGVPNFIIFRGQLRSHEISNGHMCMHGYKCTSFTRNAHAHILPRAGHGRRLRTYVPPPDHTSLRMRAYIHIHVELYVRMRACVHRYIHV